MSALLFGVCILFGDIIQLKSGGRLEGVIIHEKDNEIVVRLKYATVELNRAEIASIQKRAAPPAPAGAARLPRWDRCMELSRAKEWEGKFQQVPALVIEVGPLKHVPYMSFRSGNYEINIYGDPDAPAGIEIGLYKDLLNSDVGKRKCIEAVAELLGDPKDVEVARGLGLAAAKNEREGMVFEITPETAPEAFGGWWVSVYDAAAIEKARATQEELAKITATRQEMERLQQAAKDLERKRQEAEAKAKAQEKKEEVDERRRQLDEAEARAAASENSDFNPGSGTPYDESMTGSLVWRNWNSQGIRTPRTPSPPTPTRYYGPGYSRGEGGGYRPGPGVGGLGR